MPVVTAPAGTSRVTTALAPIWAPSPMVTGPVPHQDLNGSSRIYRSHSSRLRVRLPGPPHQAGTGVGAREAWRVGAGPTSPTVIFWCCRAGFRPRFGA